MANVQNSFIKSKLNKDLDARLVPNGEYRDAKNVQVSRSEGPNVGSLENVLGNQEVLNLSNITGDYSNNASNFIIVFNVKDNSYQILVQGAFLNFSTTHEIYHANLLENLLFWTDNRNQPRVINTDTAKERGITYYQTEDQISVAKYNPYQSIELWQESSLGGAGTYETSMKDVTSKFLPSGGSGLAKQAYSSGQTTIFILSVQGDLAAGANNNGTAAGANYGGATVGVVDGTTGAITMVANAILNTVVYSTTPGGLPQWQINITGGSFPALNENQEIVFNPNPYYDENFAGDASYLEDKFVRFSYRYKFADNEYSIMAPFTQIAFIPKQDGYFMYKKAGSGLQRIDDQTDAFQSTIVSFMENKVDDIKLKIPLPFTKTQLANATTAPLKLKELEILYKESDGLAVKVIDVIPLSDLVANPATDPNDFIYTYLSKKPTKTLPSDEITRVYDKIPVRAFAQEVSGNRIIYGNFQNKHTPPEFLDYNVGVGEKFAFSLENGTLTVPTGGNYSW